MECSIIELIFLLWERISERWGDIRLTIFWYLWLLLCIIFNFDLWFLDLNELMKINFAICNPDLSPSVGAIRLLLPRPQLLQVSPQSPSPPGEKKRRSFHLVKRKGFNQFHGFHHSDFSSLPCHNWLKPLVEDKSRAEQKDWLKPQKLLWVEKLSPHFPILSLPWLTWEAARFERTSRWFRTPWFEGIKSVFKVSSRLNGDKSYLGLGGSFSVAELVLSLWCSFLLEMFKSCKVGFDKTLPNLILLPVLPGVNRFWIRARFCSTGNCIKIWGVVSHAPL